MADTLPIPLSVIRLWPHHHGTDAAIDELLAEIARWPGCCDELWFATELGFPKMAVHLQSAERMARAAAKARAAGLQPGIQLAASIGHADTPILPSDGIAWQRLVGSDGQTASMCNCPRSKSLHDYLGEAIRAYAAFGPSSFWIDDDLRINRHSPIQHACFCDNCLAQFSQLVGRKWSREPLVAELNSPAGGTLREQWTRFNGESLAVLTRAIAQAVHAVAPHCRMGFQQVGHEFALYNGPDWGPIYREMTKVSGKPAGARLGHGCYSDARPREMIHKAIIIARQVARLPQQIDAICPEIENFTHNAMGKTAHGTVVESTLDLAMGCNCLSYAILCSGHEPMEWYGRTLLSRLAEWRPFWERMIADNRGTQLGGLDIALGRGQATRPLRNGEPPFAWAQIDLGRLSQLATLGLPLCPDSPASCGALLHADAVDGFSDAELKGLLSGGLVIDGATCVRLSERGLGSLLGVTAERFHPLDCHERLTADAINGPHAGRQWWLWFATEASSIYRLRPIGGSRARIRVLGEAIDPAGRAAGLASVAVENELGGRVVIFGFEGWDHAISGAKRWQMLAAADWASGNRLPVLIETPAQVMAVPRLNAAGQVATLTLLNVSIDSTPPLAVRVRRPAGSRASWIMPGQPDVSLSDRAEGPDCVLTVPSIAPWSIGYLRLSD